MYIDDTQLPFIPAWQGDLTTTGGETFALRGSAGQASIGQPTYWPLAAPSLPVALGLQPGAPPAAHTYGLARFPFTLRPGDGLRVQRADFTLALYPSGPGPRPTVYDAYPPTTTIDQEGEVTLALGPALKFGSVDAALAKVEGTLKLRRTAAAITVDGLGESDVRWTFLERGRTLLAGSLVVYIVLALPPGLAHARAAAQLAVRLNTPWGSLLGRLPEEAEAKVSWRLP